MILNAVVFCECYKGGSGAAYPREDPGDRCRNQGMTL